MHTFDRSKLPTAHHERLHLGHGVGWHSVQGMLVLVA